MLKENKEDVKLFLPIPTLHQALLQARSRAQGTLREKEEGGDRRKVLILLYSLTSYLKQVSLEA